MFRQTKRRTAGRRNFEEVAAYAQLEKLLYPSRLSFYNQPPLEEITLEQFEQWAIDRLRVLIEIEGCTARSKLLRETEALVKPFLLKHLNVANSIHERRKDYYSHYILRLVFCRTEELRRKFVRNETTLFKMRYNMLQPKQQQEFVELYADVLQWEYISAEEKNDVLEELVAASGQAIKMALAADNAGDSTFQMSHEQVRQHIRVKENFIKLPFERVPTFVSNRQVYLLRGHAYVPSTLQVGLLGTQFASLLNAALIKTFQALPRLEEDDRLLPLLDNLSRNFASILYEADLENADMNAVSVLTPAVTKHFPLCATHLHKNLVHNSHLRYTGRQQLGLFLKGIGLGVDEALKFWLYQFTKLGKLNMDSFNKEYRYNVGHLYGQEGGRINYKPWDCAQILLKPKPQQGEHHGCPYRDLSAESLVESLTAMGIAEQYDVNSVMEEVARHNYTMACTKVFELTHKNELERAKPEALHITHPNLYFDRSRKLEPAKS